MLARKGTPEWMTKIASLKLSEAKEESEEEEEESEEESEDESEEEEDKSEEEKPDVSGLKSALRKERKARRDHEKELKALRKFKEDLDGKKKTETETAQQERDKEKQKSDKLASKLQQQAVDFAISKIARKMKFQDEEDAILLVRRNDIEVEQDEDDPGEITVDEESVEEAVKDLLKRKPHLIREEKEDEDEEDQESTGSKFGGKKKDRTGMSEEKLRNKYNMPHSISHT